VTRTKVIALVVVAAALSGCGGGGGDAAAGRTTVDIRTFDFRPDPLETSPGTKVTFVNHDAIGHTVTSGTRKHRDGRFDKQLAASTGKTTITFDKPGRYAYFCSVHPGAGMTAEVIVD
jgi:plastocyanin